MNIDKINTPNLKPQSIQTTEVQNTQVETATCENQIETSLYNQKGVQIPFKGFFWTKHTQKIENECIELLAGARNGRYKLFTPSEAKKILTTLEQETNELERPNIIKEVFALSWDDTIPTAGAKIDLYNIDGEPISRNFVQKLIKLNAGRSENDRLAIIEFARYELDNGATEPLGAFFKLSEERIQELTPFLRRIADINYEDAGSDEIYQKNVPELYDHFRCLVYGIDDLSKPGSRLSKQKIKDELLEVINGDIDFFKKHDYPSEENKQKILELLKDMNEYAMERILK